MGIKSGPLKPIPEAPARPGKEAPTLWAVMQYYWDNDMQGWESVPYWIGVFETEDLAIAACVDCGYFIFPTQLNSAAAHEKHLMPGAYYPWADNYGKWLEEPRKREQPHGKN